MCQLLAEYDSFPKHFTFIIARLQIRHSKTYLKLMHKNVKIKFVKINNFNKKGSGLSLTLNKSKKHLNKPFIFCPCDTIFKDKINFNTNNNTIFYNNKISNKYRTLLTDKDNNLKKISLNKNNNKKIYRSCIYKITKFSGIIKVNKKYVWRS